jgi:SAM-dependent methyltransferase
VPTRIDPSALASVWASIESYYTGKVTRYGAAPAGVDWSSVPTQELRFVQLLKIVDFGRPLSLNDVGCGYGALLAYLARCHPDAEIDYFGSDLSPAMIRRARRKWGCRPGVQFAVAGRGLRAARYSVASGIFNVNLDQPLARWEGFVAQTLADMNDTSLEGFAVNFLSPPGASQAVCTSPLYRVPAEFWIAHCERVLGLDVRLVAGYGLREYTLLVRRRH